MKLVFELANLYVLPFWALLIFAPRTRVTQAVFKSLWFLFPLALAYAAFLLPSFVDVAPALARPKLDVLGPLLGSELGTTVAWLHFLAFDLFVARWIHLDAQEKNFSRLWVSPVLVCVLMVGPIGFLFYFLVREAGLKQRGASTTM